MNYREKMRTYIKCPQFGNIGYGNWGALNLNQRRMIKRLLDEIDNADIIIKKYFENTEKVLNFMQEKYDNSDLCGFTISSQEFEDIKSLLRLNYINK